VHYLDESPTTAGVVVSFSYQQPYGLSIGRSCDMHVAACKPLGSAPRSGTVAATWWVLQGLHMTLHGIQWSPRDIGPAWAQHLAIVI